MKNLIVFLAVFVMSVNFSGAQCPANIQFETQQQIDSFPANYPGCTAISGNLTIQESVSGNIRNLDSLAHIISIGGDFWVQDNDSLVSLTLTSIDSIGKKFWIKNNYALSNLSLTSLTSVGDYLHIDDNYSLTNVDGLNGLTSIGESLGFYNNTSLSSLAGLSNLTSIGGHLYIGYNSSLTSLDGLQNISPNSIHSNSNSYQDLNIIDNPNLSECVVESICELLKASGTTTEITNNKTGCITEDEIKATCVQCPNDITFTTQQQIDSFPVNYSGCKEISGNLRIEESVSGNIRNLDSLAHITFIGGDFHVWHNDSLTDISFNNIDTIMEHFSVSYNSLLSNLSFNNINIIGGNFSVSHNSSLSDLTFNSLVSIEGSFFVAYNSSLTHLLFSNIDTIREGFMVGSNDLLTSLYFPKLTFIGRYFYIESNNELANIDGLNGVTSIDGDLNIINNSALASLSGLSNLTTVDGFLYIANNTALVSLNGLQNIDPNTIHTTQSLVKDLNIFDNPNLSECAVESICELLNVSGTTTDIHSNKTWCNNEDEIKYFCNLPECTSVTSPANGATNVKISTDILWATAARAEGYYLTIGTSSGGIDILNNIDVGNVTIFNSNNFPSDTTLFVTITPYNGAGSTTGCAEKYFKTEKATAIKEFDESNLSNNLVNIYPNPAKNVLFVKPLDKQVVVKSIQVIDVSGKTIIEKSLNTSEINVSSLKNGAYFIKVHLQEGFAYKKIVISK